MMAFRTGLEVEQDSEFESFRSWNMEVLSGLLRWKALRNLWLFPWGDI